MKPAPSSVGYKSPSGVVSDTVLHEEILRGVDDSAPRLMSAQRAVERLGLTRAKAEELFDVDMQIDTVPPNSLLRLQVALLP